MYSNEKERVYLQNFTVNKPILYTLSQNRCTCGNCQVVGRVEACICCQEIEAVQNKLIELSPVVNAKSSHNASHSILGFMQFAFYLIDGCCR